MPQLVRSAANPHNGAATRIQSPSAIRKPLPKLILVRASLTLRKPFRSSDLLIPPTSTHPTQPISLPSAASILILGPLVREACLPVSLWVAPVASSPELPHRWVPTASSFK